MKRILSFVLCLVLLVSVFPLAVSVSAAKEYTEGYYTYTVKDAKATIVRCRDKSKAVRFPSKLGKYPVVAIGNDVMWDGFENNQTSITIPEGVVSIGSSAFSGCTEVTKIVLPSTLTTIGDYAFNKNIKLKSITIPKKVRSIGKYAFDECRALTAITVESGNSTYCSVGGVLYNKAKTKLIRYPSAKKGSSFTVPKSVTTIEAGAFSICSNLKEITLPAKLTTIGEAAFKGSAITALEIPDGVKNIGSGAFSWCSKITEIVIPNSVRTIGTHTFVNSYRLKSVALGKNINKIPDETFFGCSALKKLSISGTITEVGWCAFYDCGKLTDVYYGGTKAQKNKIKVNKAENDAINNAKWHYLKPVDLKITTQPKTGYAQLNKTAKVSVKASGNGLKYQWYIKNAGATKYSKSSITSATYSVKMTERVYGRRVYCMVTDVWGNKVQSNTVLLRRAASIVTQPKTVTVKKNATAKVTMKASGDGLKYTWYIKNAGSSKYTKSSVTKSTYSCKMTSKANGRYVYCVVKDKYGKTVQTKTVRVKMK